MHRRSGVPAPGRGAAREIRAALGTVIVTAALVAGCASSTTGPNAATPGAPPPGTAPLLAPGTAVAARPPCDAPPVEPLVAAAVPGAASDVDLTSFDGTTIRLHWFPVAQAAAGAPAPTVLMGPGWSLPGDTDVDAVGVLGALNIGKLRGAGFNVLTWDPRGFGKSGGLASVNSADHEGRDVQRLLDWVTTQPAALLDSPTDPRVGMVGGSYGGGIQLVAAGVDCRVDATVPVIAWHELTSSLNKADTAKIGWGNILARVGGARVDPHVAHANASIASTGQLEPEDRAWFSARGVTDHLARITAPTLFIQGTVDTLFTLDEAVSNYRALRDRGVPTGMIWFCGGHGTCLTKPGDSERVAKASLAWLTRYLRDDPSVDLGPRVSILDQEGVAWAADDYPLAPGPVVAAEGAGTLALTADGGAGPVPSSATPDMLSTLVLPITPSRAANAVDVGIDAGSTGATIVGAPTVRLSYSGTAPAGDRPTRVFAQLVDESTGFVVGNQITPIPVTLDGQRHEATATLEIVAFSPKPGSRLTLQLVATTVAYAPPRLGGSVQFDRIRVELPTAATLTPG